MVISNVSIIETRICTLEQFDSSCKAWGTEVSKRLAAEIEAVFADPEIEWCDRMITYGSPAVRVEVCRTEQIARERADWLEHNDLLLDEGGHDANG